MKPISEQQLQNRLGSGSKRRLRQFRSAFKADRDCRNYDRELDIEFSKYASNPKDYEETKEYLRNLKSQKDGKLFSQGVKSYKQLLEAVERFTEPNHTSFRWNRNYQRAKAELKENFAKLKLSMLQYHDDESMIDALPKTDTHSGYTYLETGKRKKRENLGKIYSRYCDEEKKARESGSFNKPILPGTRTQGSGAFTENGERTNDCKHKTRLVSMIDLMVIFAELKFANPIQKALAGMRWYAGGKDPSQISTIITNMRHDLTDYVSLDYSAYDQSVSNWLIEDAFEIIGAAFVDLDEQLFSIIVEDFINKNFVFGDGVVSASKGVPSGSMFTQIIDSVVNVLMITTYLYSKDVTGQMIVMGDDNLLYTKGKIDVEDIATYIRKNFGVTVNSDKTTSGQSKDDPEFLSREWRADGQYREPHEVMGKMLYPERYRNYSEDRASAQMVLYAYILTYPLTMQKIMNVDQFLMDNPNLSKRYVMNSVDSRYLPGALAFIREYT